MAQDTFEKFYKDVPQEQKEQLRRFRETHPIKLLDVEGADWQYISCGQGDEALLILPGATGNGEMAFKLIMELEKEYRIVSPTYPLTATTMAQLMDGVACLLDAEGIPHAHVLGGSFGGALAQCFVRKYPHKVDNLILSHTVAPRGNRVKRTNKIMKILSLFPLWLIRVLFKRETGKLLPAEHAEYEFWQAYLSEEIFRLNKEAIKSILRRGIDLDQHYSFTPEDLKDWPGKILIMESSDDPMAQQVSRESLKVLYPRAQVHTFHGTGHASSILKSEEYLSTVRNFLKAI